MDCDRVKGFSALVTRYLKIDLRPFVTFYTFSQTKTSLWGLNTAFVTISGIKMGGIGVKDVNIK
jgi:hypothetical protein